MKRSYIFFSMLILVILALLCSCKSEDIQSESINIIDPVECYESALALQDSRSNAKLYTIASQRIDSKYNTYRETTTQQISCSPSGIQVLQEIYYTDQPLSVQVDFTEDTAYLQLGGNAFSQTMAPEEFCESYFPIPLPHPEHYAEIIGTKTNNGTVIIFRQPISADVCKLPEYGELLDTATYVVIDNNGFIAFISQQLEYTLQGVTIHAVYALSYVDNNTDISLPLPDNAKPVEDLQYPLVAEKASGYLLQANNNLKASITKQISSQVTNTDYVQSIDLTHSYTSSTHSAEVKTTVNLTDHNRSDSVTNFQQTESFTDGIYTITSNNEPSQIQSNITEDQFFSYFNNLLLENIVLPQYITDISAQIIDDLLYVEFKVNDALAQVVANNACKTLYQEPALLDTMINSCTTEAISVYIKVDPVIGTPRSAGIEFTGRHALDSTAYTITSKSNISYNFD